MCYLNHLLVMTILPKNNYNIIELSLQIILNLFCKKTTTFSRNRLYLLSSIILQKQKLQNLYKMMAVLFE